jgi:cytochrome c biogenesis protein CcdA
MGVEMRQSYDIGSPNTLIIDGETTIEGVFNEQTIRKILDGFSQPSLAVLPLLGVAFTFGFFESFSPCVIIVLAFILSYTVGINPSLQKGVLRVIAFGTGFLLATLSIGLLLHTIIQSLQAYRIVITVILCGVVLVLGLNLLGILPFPSATKLLVQQLTRKLSDSLGSLLFLGFIFYFLDPCIAPVFMAMIPLLSAGAFPMIISAFSVGVMLPFVIIGLLASSISRFARTTYRYRSRIRALSGLILIGYAIYILIFHL